MPALFSIVTPAYNRAGLVEETLESVYAQDHRPIEHIVVDDGSSDDTVAVIRRWIAQLAERPGFDAETYRVELIEKPNGGVSSARNVGLRSVTGQYIHFLDSDDLLEPGVLGKLVSCFEETGADLVFAGFRRFDEETGEILMNAMPAPADRLRQKALDGSLWGNAGRISLRRDLAEAMGPWDETFRVFEDREYSERAVMMAECPASLQASLVRVRIGSGPWQNDVLRSRFGRTFRIASEGCLLERARSRTDLPASGWSAFRSRLYALSMRSYAEGWLEHGSAAKRLADSIDVPLDRRGKLRRLAARLGVVGGRIYVTGGAIKKRLSGA